MESKLVPVIIFLTTQSVTEIETEGQGAGDKIANKTHRGTERRIHETGT